VAANRGNWSTAILGAAVLLAGCGGGDELTRGEFIARADALCEVGRESFAGLQSRPPRDSEAAARLTAELIEISEEELGELDELEPPDDLRAPMGDYLSAREDALELFRRGHDAAERGDTRAYAEAQRQAAAGQVERLRLARGIGLERCSRPQPTGSGPSPSRQG
jgi:hypothetical protein